TPGAIASTSQIARPRGTVWSVSLLKLTADPVVATSTTGPAPLTSMVSVIVPIFSGASIFATKPTASCTSERTNFWKPESSNVMVYTPDGRSGMRYVPSASVVAESCGTWSAGLVTVTDTPGSAALLSSVTTPWMAPEALLWARAAIGLQVSAASSI